MKRQFTKIKKAVTKTNYFVSAILLFTLGIIILIGQVPLFKNVVNIVLFIMLLFSLKEIINLIIKKEKDKLSEDIILFIVVLILFIYRDISIAIVPIIFGSYMIINGIIKLVSYILLRINKVKHSYSVLFVSVIFLTLGVLMIFSPLMNLKNMLIILGIYSILLSITSFFDFLDEVNPNRKHFFQRKIRITMPAFIDVFIPYSVMNKINKLFNSTEELVLEEKKLDVEPDMEIFVHVSDDPVGKFGHADMYFEGEVISYGAYDKDNRILNGAIGRSTLFIADKEPYVKFCVTKTGKILFGFGLKLTDKQKCMVRKKIKKMKENLIPWDNTLKADIKMGKEVNPNDYKDYANRLYNATTANFYKFKSGKYKMFFIFGTNCVSLLDSIVGPAGIDILKLNGVITPGTYYDYLNNEFLKHGSHVISKTIYNEIYFKRKSDTMDYLLIEHPKCSTCKKAKMWLDTHNIGYKTRNIITKNPTKQEIATYLKNSHYEINKIFNTSGIYYRQMNLKEKLKTMTNEEKLELLSTNGMLIKRPILITKDKVLFGFKEKEWKEIINLK